MALIEAQRRILPRIGTRKLQLTLHRQGVKAGRDELFKLLKTNKLLISRKPKTYRTTRPCKSPPRYPNRLPNHRPTQPGQAWVSDITYLRFGRSYRFLALVLDVFTRRIVGHAISPYLHAEVVCQALTRAYIHHRPQPGCLLHADQGTQYNSNELANLLHHFDMQGSMSRRGIPQDNAYAERVFRTLKEEFKLNSLFRNEQDLVEKVNEAIHLYNHYRPHLSLSMQNPVEFEMKHLPLLAVNLF